MQKHSFTPYSLIEDEKIYRDPEIIAEFLSSQDNLKHVTSNLKFKKKGNLLYYSAKFKDRFIDGMKDDRYVPIGHFKIDLIDSMAIAIDEDDDTLTVTINFTKNMLPRWCGNLNFFKGRVIYSECKETLKILDKE